MGVVLAIDPGRKHTGWALFYDGVLIACGVTTTKHTKDEAAVIDDHVRQLAPQVYKLVFRVDEVRVEQPQVYTLRKQKGDQNDLMRIFGIGCAIAGHFRARTHFVLPREWKGQLPKDVSHKRIEMRLSPAELDVMNTLPKAKTVRHNGLDAIGIGLKHVGRRA